MGARQQGASLQSGNQQPSLCRACAHTHTHTHMRTHTRTQAHTHTQMQTRTHSHTRQTTAQNRVEWKVLSVATNGHCFSSPGSLVASSSVVQGLLGLAFSLSLSRSFSRPLSLARLLALSPSLTPLYLVLSLTLLLSILFFVFFIRLGVWLSLSSVVSLLLYFLFLSSCCRDVITSVYCSAVTIDYSVWRIVHSHHQRSCFAFRG